MWLCPPPLTLVFGEGNVMRHAQPGSVLPRTGHGSQPAAGSGPGDTDPELLLATVPGLMLSPKREFRGSLMESWAGDSQGLSLIWDLALFLALQLWGLVFYLYR